MSPKEHIANIRNKMAILLFIAAPNKKAFVISIDHKGFFSHFFLRRIEPGTACRLQGIVTVIIGCGALSTGV